MQTEAAMIAMARTNVDGVALAAEYVVVVDVMVTWYCHGHGRLWLWLWLRLRRVGGRAAGGAGGGEGQGRKTSRHFCTTILWTLFDSTSNLKFGLCTLT